MPLSHKHFSSIYLLSGSQFISALYAPFLRPAILLARNHFRQQIPCSFRPAPWRLCTKIALILLEGSPGNALCTSYAFIPFRDRCFFIFSLRCFERRVIIWLMEHFSACVPWLAKVLVSMRPSNLRLKATWGILPSKEGRWRLGVGSAPGNHPSPSPKRLSRGVSLQSLIYLKSHTCNCNGRGFRK